MNDEIDDQPDIESLLSRELVWLDLTCPEDELSIGWQIWL